MSALIEKHQDLWDQLVNHPFCQSLAANTCDPHAFRDYMIVSLCRSSHSPQTAPN